MEMQLNLATSWDRTEDRIIALADFSYNFNSGPRRNIDTSRLLLGQARDLILQDSKNFAYHYVFEP